MKLGYSEFSFGYAFTENLIRSTSSGATIAPYFPNLRDEGSLGFDVDIRLPGCPLFLQFKLPDRMIKNNATEISKYALPDIHTPFYRLYLMKRSASQQHAHLVKWEDDWPHAVYYAAPCIPDVAKFNQAYVSVNVHKESALFSPKDIGVLPNDNQHSVSYRPDKKRAWFCSEPREIRVLRIEEIYLRHMLLHDDPRYRRLQSVVAAIGETILPAIPPSLRAAEATIRQRIRARRASVADEELDPDSERVREDLLVFRVLSRVGLGVDLLVSQPPR